MTLQEAENAFQLADDIWQIALEYEFGVRASNMRYTDQGRGAEGSKLRAAYDARVKAHDDWQAARKAVSA